MNKAGLIAALVRRAQVSKPAAARVVEALFGADGLIATELKRGQRVQITGFGTFQPRKRAERMGRHPRTGNPIRIDASLALRFRPGAKLKAALNRRR